MLVYYNIIMNGLAVSADAAGVLYRCSTYLLLSLQRCTDIIWKCLETFTTLFNSDNIFNNNSIVN